MTQPITPGGLARALCAARLDLKATVHRGGFNKHNGYHYVGHEDVLTSGARESLARNELALLQTGIDLVGEVPGGKTTILLWRGKYKLLHVSGEQLDIEVAGTTQHNDKCAYQASTMLDRTVYLRLLALAGSSDEDTDFDGKRGAPQQNAPEQGARAQAVAATFEPKKVQPAAAGPAPEALAAIKTLHADVTTLDKETQLVTWAKMLRRVPVDKVHKEAAWTAFADRAGKLGLDAVKLIKEADAQLKAARDERAA